MIEIIRSWILFSGKQKRINSARLRVFPALVVLSALFFGVLFANNTRAEPTPYSSEEVNGIRKAAYQGYADAQQLLGVIYLTGLGLPQDDTQANVWFRKAAEQGNATAQFMLGLSYIEGNGGVPQDYSQAVAWIHKAAVQGYAVAQYTLGLKYYDGKGVPQDYSQAEIWYRRAANQGDENAQNNLGLMYARGEGVPQDYSQAYMWINLAATKGLENAINSRNVLIKKLTSSQIEEGQRLTREWIAQHPQLHIAQ
ncbi:MAG: hypothetical protein RLZ75_1449 [Pseudomonadota bacterium]|jgi:TPR repeat protein